MDELVKAATSAAVGALTKAAIEPALSGGRQVWDWIKTKISGDEARTASAIEATPDKPSTASKVAALLQDLLHENPTAAEELKALLNKHGGVQAITQTANVSGKNAKVTQIAGNNNTVRNG
jgi:hypothetical protein